MFLFSITITKTPTSKEELLALIDELRRDLVCIGMKEGLKNSKTIEVSQRLDVLIAKYQTITLNNPLR